MTPEVIIGLAIIIAFTVIAVVIILSRTTAKMHQEHDDAIKKRTLELEDLALRIDNFQIDFSKSYLEYVKYIVAQISITSFQTFYDNHDVSKATKAQIASVVEEVARTAQSVVQFDKIDFNHMKFTRAYLEKFIINTSIMNIKKLLKDAVENYDEM